MPGIARTASYCCKAARWLNPVQTWQHWACYSKTFSSTVLKSYIESLDRSVMAQLLRLTWGWFSLRTTLVTEDISHGCEPQLLQRSVYMIISLPFHRPSQLQIITAHWPVSNYTECLVTRVQRCEQLAPSYYAPNKESTHDPLITSPTTDLLCHHAKPPQITKSLSVLINKVKKIS